MITTATEADIAAVSTAPRVTAADVEANIASEHYFTAADGAYASSNRDWAAGKTGPFGEPGRKPGTLDLLTFCVLVLRNGFTVTGESACASPENFNAALGRVIARENAVDKVWLLMGHQLKEQLYQRTQPAQAPTA